MNTIIWQDEEEKIMQAAIDKWGNVNQMDMAIEECAELIQAINKLKRKATAESIEHICEEIADVEIMIKQLRMILNKDGVISNIKDIKLARLRKSLTKI